METNKTIKREIFTPSTLMVREREDNQPSRTITGYAIIFNQPSEVLFEDDGATFREVIEPQAVTKALLDECDIKFTMFHDRQLILARSTNGKGTLSYRVDDKGVEFEFEAPHTVDGDKALELVRRGDLNGCSFAFATRYWDDECVERTSEVVDGNLEHTYHVKRIFDVDDFTLAAAPAYPQTSVDLREMVVEQKKNTRNEESAKQVAEMRETIGKFKF